MFAIALDSSGNKWFGTYYGGVSKYDGTTWTTYNRSNGLAHNWVHEIAADNRGNIWVGTVEGLSRFDGTKWTTFDTSDGLDDANINTIAVDHNGNIWVGTELGGASEFDGTKWTTYRVSDGLICDLVDEIAIDEKGNKWFGTVYGVSKYDGTTWTTYKETDGLANRQVSAIAIDSEGNKWFGTFGGGVSMLVASSETRIKDEKTTSSRISPEYSIINAGKYIVIRYSGQIPMDATTLSLYNILGKCIRRVTVKKPENERNIELSIAGISNGNYILRIHSKALNTAGIVTLFKIVTN